MPTLLEEIALLTLQRDAMVDALEDLIAEQNGPPLIMHAKTWNEAMDKAKAAIALCKTSGIALLAPHHGSSRGSSDRA
jgi:hypothetical protein